MNDSDLLVVTKGIINGEGLTYAHVGPQNANRYIVEFVKDQLFGVDNETLQTTVYDYTAALLPSDADITTQIVDADFCRWSDGHLIMPLRVHMAVGVDTPDWSTIEIKISRRERKRDAKWRADTRHTWRLSHDDAEYVEFYRSMVAPSMELAHGSRSRMLSLEAGRADVFSKGGLFLVEEDGVAVAGSVSEIDYQARRVTGRIIGVRDGNPFHRGGGAQNALYHLLIRWAWENRMSVVDFGNCEAFLSKGTFQYKMRFGTEVILPPNHQHTNLRVMLNWNASSRGIRDFLISNPVVTIRKSGEIGVTYFKESSRGPRIDISYLPTTGLSFECHYSL